MNNLLNKSQKFLKRNSATILTCVGAAGVIATTVTAVKATPKALTLLENAKKEKGEGLTRFETVKIAGPAYIPSVVLGVSTLACIFGANMLNHRKQASLISAYALLDRTYKDYKGKVIELYGDESSHQIVAGIAKDKYEEEPYEIQNDNNILYFDAYSGRYFETTPAKVSSAEYELNRTLMLEDGVYLNEWYLNLDLEPLEQGYDFGWSTTANMDAYWQTWVDFHHEKVEMDDGLECIIVSFMQEPHPNFEEL